MSILLRRTSAILSLLALVLCLPQGTLMLCAGEGGHVALEAACGDDASVAHAEQAAGVPEGGCDCDSGCGPCRDSQVGAELSPGRVRDHGPGAADALGSAVLLPSATVPPSLAAPPRAARLAMAPPRPPARVAAGVQLRI
jgi:hypothetical protein